MTKHAGYARRFTVRLTRSERIALHERARYAGLSLSRYLVEASLTTGNPPSPELRAERERLLFQLHKVGVNLNQLARRMNSEMPVADQELLTALEAVTDTIEALNGTLPPCPVYSSHSG